MYISSLTRREKGARAGREAPEQGRHSAPARKKPSWHTKLHSGPPGAADAFRGSAHGAQVASSVAFASSASKTANEEKCVAMPSTRPPTSQRDGSASHSPVCAFSVRTASVRPVPHRAPVGAAPAAARQTPARVIGRGRTACRGVSD